MSLTCSSLKVFIHKIYFPVSYDPMFAPRGLTTATKTTSKVRYLKRKHAVPYYLCSLQLVKVFSVKSIRTSSSDIRSIRDEQFCNSKTLQHKKQSNFEALHPTQLTNNSELSAIQFLTYQGIWQKSFHKYWTRQTMLWRNSIYYTRPARLNK